MTAVDGDAARSSCACGPFRREPVTRPRHPARGTAPTTPRSTRCSPGCPTRAPANELVTLFHAVRRVPRTAFRGPRRGGRGSHPGGEHRTVERDRPLRPGAGGAVLHLRGRHDRRRTEAALPRQGVGVARAAPAAGARGADQSHVARTHADARALARRCRSSRRISSVGTDEIAEAMDAVQAYSTTSLDAPVGWRGLAAPVDTLGGDDPSIELLDEWSSIAPAVAELSARDRRVLFLRFFRGLTQSEIAEDVGVSQMHVSRILTQTLERLRAAATRSVAARNACSPEGSCLSRCAAARRRRGTPGSRAR